MRVRTTSSHFLFQTTFVLEEGMEFDSRDKQEAGPEQRAWHSSSQHQADFTGEMLSPKGKPPMQGKREVWEVIGTACVRPSGGLSNAHEDH